MDLSLATQLIKRGFYRGAILVLSAGNHILGPRFPDLKHRLHYLRGLLWERRYSEFNAILARYLKRRLAWPSRRTFNLKFDLSGGIKIDVRRQRLLPDGTLASKQSLIFRSREADKLVSVMITCAGHRKHLPDTIASVRAQTLASVEIVVVDDGSDDAETSRSLECLQSQCEIKLVGVNGKTSSASRNDGIAVSTGEYICCLDAGDTLQPTYLEKVVALMETDRSVGFAYSHVRLLGDGENVWTTHDFEIDAALLGEPTALSAVFRRDDWVLLGGFDINEMEGASGDLGFWLRLACLGRCGRSIPEQLVSHRGGMPDKPDPQRAISEDRIQPVSLLTRQFRTTLRRLKPFPRAEPALYKLGQPKLLATQPDHPHILVMVPWLSNGGGELLLFDVLASLRSSYRISILTTLSDAHALSERFATITSEIYHLPRFLAEQDFADFAAAIIGSRQTQLLLSSNCAFAYKSGAALKRSFPDLRWADIMHNALPTGHLKGALAAADHIDCHVAVTAPIVEALRTSDIPEDHIALIPNGVDTEELFNPDKCSRREARERLNIPPDRQVLAFVGRMSTEKRPLAFLDILVRLRQLSAKNLIGLMVGDGPLSAEVERRIGVLELENEVRRIARITREEMPQIYAAADFLVVTSDVEGMPLAVLEAMAMDCPVASTDVGGVRSFVGYDKLSMLVPSSQPLLLADKLAALLASTEDKSHAVHPSPRSVVLEKGGTLRAMLASYNLIVHALCAQSNRISEPGKQS